MSYKTILVYLKSAQCIDSVLDVAVPLAEHHDAHITALYLEPDIPIYGAVEVQFTKEILEQQRASFHEESERIREIFLKKTHAISDRAEWRSLTCVHSKICETIAEHALCSDLVVISQSDEEQRGLWPDLPADIAIESGRPVLVIPKHGKFDKVGKTSLVAWNSSKEAARAAFDAVPFLKESDNVHVMSINPATNGGHNTLGRGDDLAISLSRHGVTAEVTASYNTDIPASDEILSRAADLDCDLIVMGCYGHSRLRETLFGGMSRNMLRTMTVPVLMAH